jgi:hypothetical protein
MISQKCPKCLSKRVRRGYRPTPLWSKILFRYNLLCDNCNWEFVGFAVPGTVSAKPTRSPKKKPTNKLTETSDNHKSNETSMDHASNNSISSLEKEAEEEIESLEKEEKEEAAEKSGANENLAHKSVKAKKKVKRKSGV